MEKSVEVLMALQTPMTPRELADFMGNDIDEIRRILNAGHQYGLLKKNRGKYEWDDKQTLNGVDTGRRYRGHKRRPARRHRGGKRRHGGHRYNSRVSKQKAPKKDQTPKSQSQEK